MWGLLQNARRLSWGILGPPKAPNFSIFSKISKIFLNSQNDETFLTKKYNKASLAPPPPVALETPPEIGRPLIIFVLSNLNF